MGRIIFSYYYYYMHNIHGVKVILCKLINRTWNIKSITKNYNYYKIFEMIN